MKTIPAAIQRRVKMLGLGALVAGSVMAVSQPASAAPRYRSGQWYTVQGQRLQYRDGGRWYDNYGSRRYDLDRDGRPNWNDNDIDGDGIPNSRDRDDYRPNQWYYIRGQRVQFRNDGYWYDGRGSRRYDLDRDGIPNWRDRDRDGDGVRNNRDNRPNNPYRGSRDNDRDGIRNSRDRDRDGDGVRNSRDNHPNNPNRGTRDNDRDGIRNSRDRDRDGDGRRNSRDNHPNNPRRR